MTPIRVGRKGKRVEMRRHIAGSAGITVVAPNATHLTCFFQDHKIMDAALFEPDCSADAAKTTADNGNLYMGL